MSMNTKEIRNHEVEFRSNISESGDMVISGYVNQTEQFSDPLSLNMHEKFIEKISKGAFTRAIERAFNKGKHIDFLAEHNNKQILSSTRNNSLYLEEDERGLFMSAVIAPTSWGKDFYELVSSGIIKNFSFGFNKIEDEWDFRDNGTHVRTIKDLDLFEVSLVRHPAYSQSFAEARGITSSEDIYEEELRRYNSMEENKEIEIREDVEETEEIEATDSLLDPTESIISINSQLETIEKKLNEVLALFLNEEVSEEVVEEEKEIEEVIEEPVKETVETDENENRSIKNKETNLAAIESIKKIIEGR